jgi:hypothetical protein
MGQYRDKAVNDRGERSSTELISACRNTTYTPDNLGLGGNGRCFDASPRIAARCGAYDRAAVLPRTAALNRLGGYPSTVSS